MRKAFSTILITLALLFGFQFIFDYLPSIGSQINLQVRAANDSTSYEFPPLKITDWTKGRLEELGGGNWVMGLLVGVINWFLAIAAALAVLALIYSGLMYVTSSGNPERAEKAKKNLTWAIIALVIIALAILIPRWLSEILGASK